MGLHPQIGIQSPSFDLNHLVISAMSHLELLAFRGGQEISQNNNCSVAFVLFSNLVNPTPNALFIGSLSYLSKLIFIFRNLLCFGEKGELYVKQIDR